MDVPEDSKAENGRQTVFPTFLTIMISISIWYYTIPTEIFCFSDTFSVPIQYFSMRPFMCNSIFLGDTFSGICVFNRYRDLYITIRCCPILQFPPFCVKVGGRISDAAKMTWDRIPPNISTSERVLVYQKANGRGQGKRPQANSGLETPIDQSTMLLKVVTKDN